MSKKRKNKRHKTSPSDETRDSSKSDDVKKKISSSHDNEKDVSQENNVTVNGSPGSFGKAIPWLIFGLCTWFFALKPAVSPPQVKEGFNYHAFGRLPVQSGGRIKPLDTVARNSLLRIAGQEQIALEGNGPDKQWGELYHLHQKNEGKGLYYKRFYQFSKHPKKLHPTQWLMEVLMKPDVADQRFIFRVSHPELLSELQLQNVGIDKSGLRFYSFEQLLPYVVPLHEKGRVINKKKADSRNPYERAALKLANALELYIQLRSSLQPNRMNLGNNTNTEPSGFTDYAGHLLRLEREGADNEDAYRSLLSSHRGDVSVFPQLFHGLRLYGDVTQADLDKKDSSHLVAKARDSFKQIQSNALNQLSQMPDAARRQFLRINQAIESYFTLEEDEQSKIARHLLEVEAPLQNMKLRSNLHMIPEKFEDPDWNAHLWMQSVIDALKDREAVRALPQGLSQWNSSKWGKLLNSIIEEIERSRLANPVESAWTDAEAKSVREFAIDEIRLDRLKSPDPDWEPSVWHKTAESILEGIKRKKLDAPLHRFAEMSTAYVNDKPEAFNQAISKYNDWMQEDRFVVEANKGKEEHYYNTLGLLSQTQVLYVFALILACFSWLRMSRMLINTAFYLIGLAFVLHTAGLIFRMYLEGRPPVTNLYSSAVFVGWGAALLGWIVERIYRNGIGSCVAALAGFSTLMVASALAQEGDTMAQLVAVLDTNFWLATHVVCITIGYAATFLAGFLGIVYVVRGVFTPSFPSETAKSLARSAYGVVCFATLFSFVGTVLGGIWADQSWGRFWGWDPKENGALLIVVWNAIILHCRWGGFVQDRGLMNLAIFGNVITAWSWFGVNMLGSGLHSYGFMDEAFKSLQWFAISQLLLILVAAQPLYHWLSNSHLSKGRNPIIVKSIVALMGIGIAWHVLSHWITDGLSYLGIGLVCVGVMLSFMTSDAAGPRVEKTA